MLCFNPAWDESVPIRCQDDDKIVVGEEEEGGGQCMDGMYISCWFAAVRLRIMSWRYEYIGT